ncbi:MAG: polyprenyl synthetase family protein [Xanthomonadales bacterium]|nr:polyprenyl synthetase family protein [Xanthomonadales bacterium]MDH4018855.1 polyprenyl synthetase family protein [Xanthomonadales bacterium]
MTFSPQTAKPDNRNSIEEIISLSAPDMKRVDACIEDSLKSDVLLINQIAHYIVASGGKRLRPMLLTLCAHACGYKGHDHVPLAAIIEFIHTATLLHDDVVDESELRRGQQSAHAVWGNAASVLVGDFLYSRSFQMMVGLNSMRIMEVLANTTNTIAEGEVQQLLNMGDPDVDQHRYMQVIENKTAKLFEAACKLAAIIGGQSQEVEQALAIYGSRLGSAFQIADDVLDYNGDADTMGKNAGEDIAEGKPTLPLILARERCDDQERKLLDSAIRNGGADDLKPVLAVIEKTGSINSAMEIARQHALEARKKIVVLPESPWRTALEQLADFSVNRNQ